MARWIPVERPVVETDSSSIRVAFSLARRAFLNASLDVHVPSTAGDRAVEAAYVAACEAFGRRPSIGEGRVSRG